LTALPVPTIVPPLVLSAQRAVLVYLGGGILGRMDFAGSERGRFYTEGSLVAKPKPNFIIIADWWKNP